VRDLVREQFDRIDLSAIDADANTAGDQAFSFVGSAVFSGVAGELRAVTSLTNSTVFGDVNGDKVADFAIQVIGIATMQATDFIT
jgi:serralysin